MATFPSNRDGPEFWNPDLGPHGLRDGELYIGDDTLDNPLIYPEEKFPPTLVGEIHRNSDRDASQLAQHHSLGPRHNQASPGDHIHDGGTSSNLGLWVPYGNNTNQTTVWFCTTTNPTIGNGTFESRYCKIGTRVDYHGAIVGGSTTTWGGSSWKFKLPFTARRNPANTSVSANGVAYGYSDTNTTNYVGSLWISDAGTTCLIVGPSTANPWSASIPLAWGTTGQQLVSFTLTYESVS